MTGQANQVQKLTIRTIIDLSILFWIYGSIVSACFDGSKHGGFEGKQTRMSALIRYPFHACQNFRIFANRAALFVIASAWNQTDFKADA
jgi:hypothetical protein